jgi:hypothetical protein
MLSKIAKNLGDHFRTALTPAIWIGEFGAFIAVWFMFIRWIIPKPNNEIPGFNQFITIIALSILASIIFLASLISSILRQVRLTEEIQRLSNKPDSVRLAKIEVRDLLCQANDRCNNYDSLYEYWGEQVFKRLVTGSEFGIKYISLVKTQAENSTILNQWPEKGSKIFGFSSNRSCTDATDWVRITQETGEPFHESIRDGAREWHYVLDFDNSKNKSLVFCFGLEAELPWIKNYLLQDFMPQIKSTLSKFSVQLENALLRQEIKLINLHAILYLEKDNSIRFVSEINTSKLQLQTLDQFISDNQESLSKAFFEDEQTAITGTWSNSHFILIPYLNFSHKQVVLFLSGVEGRAISNVNSFDQDVRGLINYLNQEQKYDEFISILANKQYFLRHLEFLLKVRKDGVKLSLTMVGFQCKPEQIIDNQQTTLQAIADKIKEIEVEDVARQQYSTLAGRYEGGICLLVKEVYNDHLIDIETNGLMTAIKQKVKDLKPIVTINIGVNIIQPLNSPIAVQEIISASLRAYQKANVSSNHIYIYNMK